VTVPSSAVAGTAFNFTVIAVDGSRNVAEFYPGTVHITSSDGQAVLPADAMLINGARTFSATLKTAGNRTLTARDTANAALTGTSVQIPVSAAAASELTVGAPASTSAGAVFDVTVTALDPFANTATGYTGMVHLRARCPGHAARRRHADQRHADLQRHPGHGGQPDHLRHGHPGAVPHGHQLAGERGPHLEPRLRRRPEDDVLWRESAGQLAMWLMNGSTVTTSSLLSSVPIVWTIVGVGDFNANDRADILWPDTAGQLAMWLMNVTTVVSYNLIGTVPLAWAPVGVGDFDGDGRADILWRDTGGQRGDLADERHDHRGPARDRQRPVGVGDFNGDGKADILWQDTAGQVGIWLMNGTTIGTTASVATVATWAPVVVGDFNGDGRADILWRDTSGNLAIWLMNGTAIGTNTSLGNVPGGWVTP
jgi:hypothetical protein